MGKYESQTVSTSAPLNWRVELEQLHNHDAELRLWLPETCKTALTELAAQQDDTLAHYLRKFIVVYLYGEPALRWMEQQRLGLFWEEPETVLELEAPTFYRRSISRADDVKLMGKALSPVKVFLASYLKHDLTLAAQHAETSVGRFMREILYAHCFGHRELPERLRIWTADEETEAERWESGH